uniref:Major facilitator superfamily (MFS) profile domain-containing protein n=1 Tax=Bionectria ochroleuca TaxID=29856 RepID=A0A8H7TVG1_BIOOC
MDGKIPEVSTESDKQQEIRVENALRPEHIATPRHDAEREAAETRLRHKIDRYVAPNIAIIYLLCFLDRINIGNARISTLEEDLDMHGYDYNKLLAVFYVAYIVAEMPCTFACKLIGPGWFLPGATAAFGLLTLCMAFVQSLGAAYAVRFLLGIAEAGVLPGIAYYLSRWYRRSELTFRVAVCMVMAPSQEHSEGFSPLDFFHWSPSAA